MIVSFVPGRVRLRLALLKNESLAAGVLAEVKAIPGVTGAEVKPLTGSLLIEYDPALLGIEELEALGRAALERYAPGTAIL
ncbi:MAG: ATPase P [Spirochaetaceae bacterium]|jgi:hypothetical protein|nr:ATPase P [Spirochaetaceae bacterium]